jgi:peptide/nickel transport system substrate-binding protein
MLAELVASGELPPVEERLPSNPLVTTPFSVGEYGGTWHTVWSGPSDNQNINNHLRYARLLDLSHTTGFDLFPDIAEEWGVSADGKEFTFKIREGIKWSDGTPFTTEDVQFWWEDIINDEELTPGIPLVFQSGESVMQLEVVDDYTFKAAFDEPYGIFPIIFATYGYDEPFVATPKHYLSQFHPKYIGAEQAGQLAQDAGMETWVQLFQSKYDWMINPDLPQMTAWVVEVPPDETGHTVWVRNPYYHRVDTEGNQLPYIDRVEYTQMDSDEVAVLAAANGQVDLQIRFFRGEDFVTLKQNETAGEYHILPYYSFRGTEDTALHLNQTTSDPQLREIFGDVRFRQAVSLAMDRQEINEVLFQGLGVPRQASPPEGSPYFKEEYANSFAEQDIEQANRLLDEMGLTEKDAEGYRLRPDGKTLEIIWEYNDTRNNAKLSELVKSYLHAVGIQVTLQPRERSIYIDRASSPDLQMGMWMFGGDFLGMREDYLPSGSRGGWATEWKRWLDSDGTAGEEPPQELLHISELISLAYSTTDPAERDAYAFEINEIWTENLWSIGLVGMAPRAGVIRNNFMNVPEDMPYGGYLPIPAVYAHQFYFDGTK